MTGGRTCPSGRCAEGSTLIGIVGPDGRLGHVSPPMPVDEAFVRAAHRGRPPESRFRFAEPCAESGCAQWAGDRCGLVEELTREPAAVGVLPRCAIRATCRWFSQRGAEACAVCPLVVRTRRMPAAGHPSLVEGGPS